MIGQADTASGKFAIFPAAEDGRAEKRSLLRRKYNEMTLYKAMHTYAPESENDTAAYLAYVRGRSGTTDQTVINGMTEEQFNGMVAAMEQYEGFNARANTRRERVVHVTQISLSDGARPLPHVPVIARSSKGAESNATTDANGALPAFVTRKPGELIQLFVDESGKIGTKIGEFVLQQTSASILFTRSLDTVHGNSQPHNPTSVAHLSERTPIRYVIQPHDTLSGIASKLRTSVEELVSNNRLRNRNRIFPGQVLWIYGKAPADGANAAGPRSSPASATYSVRRGDTMGAIANRHNTTVDALMEANPSVVSADRISPGQVLVVPPGTRARGVVNKGRVASNQNDNGSGAGRTSPSLVKPPPTSSMPSRQRQQQGSVEARGTRSRENQGHPIALVPFSQRRAPWIEHAFNQAKNWAGKRESEITREINFHNQLGYGKQFPSLSGSNNAWCASFVNWCLRNAGYPISSPHPYRARSFAADTTNFSQIEKPIFGAIALVGTSHVGFVYALEGGRTILLGGNQSDQINFVRYSPTNLRYYVPKSYLPFANQELKDPKLDETTASALNEALGIVVARKASGNTR